MCNNIALVRAAVRRALLFHAMEIVPQSKVKQRGLAIQDMHIVEQEQLSLESVPLLF